jgi:hypothetical protein
MTGRFKFKTHEQLLNSGWRRDTEGNYWNKESDGGYSIYCCDPSEDMRGLLGKWIEVRNGNAIETGWYITPDMVLQEVEIAEHILELYDREI